MTVTDQGGGVPKDRFAAFTSVRDAAAAAAQLLADGAPLARIWRFVVAQLLDDYESVRRHAGVEAAAKLWQDAPPTTGDARVDAALAALGEHLARRDDWPPPAWVTASVDPAEPWWFVTELRAMHARALVESPASFRKRGVFITRGALERV